MHTDEDRRGRAARGPRAAAARTARFVFDVFAPGADDIAQTHGRWLEREPGIFERAVWDEQARTLTLTRARRERRDDDGARLARTRRSGRRSSSESGFEIEACYGWFDRTPYAGREDTIWVARRRG